jgi:hypothetical protein
MVGEKRRDVLEEHPRLRKVGDVADALQQERGEVETAQLGGH